MRNKFFKLGMTVLAAISAIVMGGCRSTTLTGGASKGMKAPVITQVGNIITWNDVEGATEYLVKFGEREIYTGKTSCYLENYEQGGRFTVQAVQKENDVVVKSSPVSAKIDFPIINYNEENSQVYDFRTQTAVDILISSTIRKCIVYGGGEYKNFSITVKERTLPLIVELYDVKANYFGIEGEVQDEVPMSQIVTIKSLGETDNEFRGLSGQNGNKGKTGGTFGVGGDGGNGVVGGDGGKFNNVLIMGTQNLSFTGGKGGNGGDGGEPGWGQAVHGDGGNGGNGGAGLRTANCFVYMQYAGLLTTAGQGGVGGSTGDGDWMSQGRFGRNGESGADFIGTRTDFANLLVISTEE